MRIIISNNYPSLKTFWKCPIPKIAKKALFCYAQWKYKSY